MPRLPFLLRLVACCLLVMAAGPIAAASGAGAQEDPGVGSTTTAPTTTAPTTTAPPETTSPTSQPTGPESTVPPDGSSTTTTVYDPNQELDPDDDVAAEEDATPEEVPVVEDTVPPDPAAVVDGAVVQGVIERELRVARADALASAETVEQAAATVDQLSDRLADLQRELAKLDVAQELSVRRLEAAEVRFRERIANAVVRGNAAELDTLFTARDANQAQTRKTYLESVSEADVAAVAEYRAAKEVLDRAVVDALAAVASTRQELRTARSSLETAIRENVARRFELAVFAAGSRIVIHGFVFPVGKPYQFIDSWGFPRMIGTEYAHGHQGTDIFAAFGTPLYAVERGIVTRIGADVLGGTKLWVKGQSGTYYYYAHLSGYAPGIADGDVVDAGDVVGFVGDTGNARGGAPHLHFEVHPGGGQAVNPYGLLRVVADLSR